MAKMSPSTLRIGYRYRPARLAPDYDAIVIGSGMGGLTTAAILSDLGRKVCVLEQHYTAGGFTHSYERAGYEWDVGVHYIGEVGAATRTRKMFDYLSNGQLEWAPMADEYDRFYVGDKVFNAVAGKDEFRNNLIRQFPNETQAIDLYMRLLDRTGDALSAFGMGRGMSKLQRFAMKPWTAWKLRGAFRRITYDVLSDLTDDQDLIATLCGQWGDMGMPPRRSPFMAHAMIARHYLYGGYYPVGGSWRMAETIIPKIQAAGGEVFTYAKVEQILVENGRVAGVEMKDGHRIRCDCIISSAGVDNTFNHLLPEDVAIKSGYRQRLTSVTPSMAHLGVYIGLKGTAEELGLPKTNFWIYPGNNYDKAVDAFMDNPDAPFPVVYISFPSAKDPDYENRHPGTATIEIVAPAPYERFEKWREETWGKRGDDYEALKEALGSRLMETLYDKLPHLRGKVDYFEVSTPLSTNWFGGYQRGELYGLEHSQQRLKQDWLRPKTTIPGLWLTGQDVLTAGVTGAMMAGLITTMSMVGARKMGPLLRRIYA
ncbi:MAG: NAD(P)/FAD-dependent oxidoreductase [Gammaproteobacteria bacterium]|nr:NAD(P)/FAD-dependent oxidoreductase [Gammaproteobacteria bacterium]